ACSSRVDLPMPGSPPIRMAEPGTRPPPVTRSSSAIPVLRRGGGALMPVRPTNSMRLPPVRLWPFGKAGSIDSSTMLFHSPQESHLPLQRDVTAPQDWHTKRDLGFATLISLPLPSWPQDLHLDWALGTAVDELIDMIVAGAVDLADRSVPDDTPFIDHRDTMRDLARARHVMGYRQGGCPQLLHAG